jgi:cbb3-type cytochrome oxidase subunit 3
MSLALLLVFFLLYIYALWRQNRSRCVVLDV